MGVWVLVICCKVRKGGFRAVGWKSAVFVVHFRIIVGGEDEFESLAATLQVVCPFV